MTTVPIPRSVNDAVDVEPRRAVGRARRRRRRHRAERGAELVEPGAGLGAHRDDLAPGTSSRASSTRELERLVVDRVGLRHRDDAALDAEQPQDREVLVRLRPRALAGVDHEQEEVDPGRAGDHRAHEPLVPGDVDERERAPVGELERRVAEVDRDPAPLLLRQPVGVLAGQRADEPRLAVVDVPGGADRQRHRQARATRATRDRACERRRAATSSTSASVSVRQSSSSAAVADDADTGGSPRRSGAASSSSTAHANARELRERQRAAADARDRLLDLAADERREPLGARAHGLERLVEHPQHRDLAPRALGVEVERERPLERGERQLVRAQRALQRMAAQPLDEVGAPDDDAGLRPAEELVAGEADEIGAGGEARRGGRLVADVERARPSRGRRRAAARARCATPASSASAGCSVKPTTRKFDWCTRRSSAVSGPIARS